MTQLTCWPLDNKEYTAEALGAAQTRVGMPVP